MTEATDSSSCCLLNTYCVQGIVVSTLEKIFDLISVAQRVEEDLKLLSMLSAKMGSDSRSQKK